jgi:hypothetical protein
VRKFSNRPEITSRTSGATFLNCRRAYVWARCVGSYFETQQEPERPGSCRHRYSVTRVQIQLNCSLLPTIRDRNGPPKAFFIPIQEQLLVPVRFLACFPDVSARMDDEPGSEGGTACAGMREGVSECNRLVTATTEIDVERVPCGLRMQTNNPRRTAGGTCALLAFRRHRLLP